MFGGLMNFSLHPMTAGEARAIAGWKYECQYSFYDMDADSQDME